MNPNAKLYLGLPASPTTTYDKYMELRPEEAGENTPKIPMQIFRSVRRYYGL